MYNFFTSFTWKHALAIIVGLFVLLQLFSIPVLAKQTNPPVVREPNWDSPQTRELAQRACFDCHSNETRWPLYSRIAPVSWSITDHVVEGREAINFSTWDTAAEEADEMVEQIREGKMPLKSYLNMHPEARLTSQEKELLIAGLQATIASDPGSHPDDGEGGERGERGEEYEEDE